MNGFLCSGDLYEFMGLVIEIPSSGGPTPLKDDGSPYERIPGYIKPYLNKFCSLSQEEQEAFRVGGGCRPIKS